MMKMKVVSTERSSTLISIINWVIIALYFTRGIEAFNTNKHVFLPMILKQPHHKNTNFNNILSHSRAGEKNNAHHRDGGNNSLVLLSLKKEVGEETNDNDSLDDDLKGYSTIITVLGILSQPVVWTSLYYVATTGAGLPAGPFGIIGATEGISYLIVVALVAKKLVSTNEDGGKTTTIAESLSLFTLAVSLAVLINLVASQGCIPNAKPILDYSNYLRVCEETPGLFGK